MGFRKAEPISFMNLVRMYYAARDKLNARAAHKMDGPGQIGTDSEIAQLKRNKEMLACRLLAHPSSFDHLRYWMVDVTAPSTIRFSLGESKLRNLVDRFIDEGHSTVDTAGKLARVVRLFIEQTGHGMITDSGMGNDSWTLGVHCTDREARELIEALRGKFGELVERGILRVERMPWSIRLKDENILFGDEVTDA